MKIAEMTEQDILDNLSKKEPPLYGVILDLSEKQLTPAIIRKAVEISFVNFALIKDDKHKTDEIISLALKKLGYKVSKEKLKENIIDIIKENKYLFRDLPERLRDKQTSDVAIKHLGHRSIPFIPKNILTEEMCHQALHDLNDEVDFRALNAIPYSSVCLSILKKIGEKEGAYNLMRYFNPDAIDSAVASEAVRQELSCIALIPPGVEYDFPPMTEREREDIRIVDSPYFEPVRLKNLPVERRTEIVSLAAVIKNADNLPDVPKNSRTDIVIDTALKKNGSLIMTLAPEEITEERQLLALKNLPYDLPDVVPPLSLHLLDENICQELVSNSPHLIKHLPENLRTPRVCSAAYDNLNFFDDIGYQILPFIPVNIICTNLKKLGWQDISRVIDAIKPENLNSRMIEWAINDRSAFELIPQNKLTAEHCLIQEKKEPGYFKDNPELLPKQVRDTWNIYELNKLVEDLTKERFSFKQIQDLYSGKQLDGCKKSFVYNPQNKSLRLIEYKQKKQVEPKNEKISRTRKKRLKL